MGPKSSSSKVKLSGSAGRGHSQPSSAQQPSEPHVPLLGVPRIQCPPPKPPSLLRSPSCLLFTATGMRAGGEEGPPSHWYLQARLRHPVPYCFFLSGKRFGSRSLSFPFCPSNLRKVLSSQTCL